MADYEIRRDQQDGFVCDFGPVRTDYTGPCIAVDGVLMVGLAEWDTMYTGVGRSEIALQLRVSDGGNREFLSVCGPGGLATYELHEARLADGVVHEDLGFDSWYDLPVYLGVWPD